jgi:hypothetical protein
MAVVIEVDTEAVVMGTAVVTEVMVMANKCYTL